MSKLHKDAFKAELEKREATPRIEEEINVIAQKWQLVNGIQEDIKDLITFKLHQAGEEIKSIKKEQSTDNPIIVKIWYMDDFIGKDIDTIIARLCGEEGND